MIIIFVEVTSINRLMSMFFLFIFYQIAAVLVGYGEEWNPTAEPKTPICPDHVHHQSGSADAQTWCVTLKT